MITNNHLILYTAINNKYADWFFEKTTEKLFDNNLAILYQIAKMFHYKHLLSTENIAFILSQDAEHIGVKCKGMVIGHCVYGAEYSIFDLYSDFEQLENANKKSIMNKVKGLLI